MNYMCISKKNKNMVNKSLFILLFLTVIGGIAFAGSAPSGLRCELLTNPAAAVTGNLASTTPGIKDATPEFGWIVNSDVSNDVQAAYQIMLATTQALLDANNPDMWDSTKTASDNSVNVSYAGSALSTNQSCFWKVRTWNKLDEPSAWSAVQEIKTSSAFSEYSESSMARYKQIVTEVKPVSVTKIADRHYLADFGKATFGFLRWTVPNNSLTMDTAEQRVQLYLSEKLLNGLVDRNPGGTIRSYTTTITIDGSPEYDVHVGSRDKIPSEFGRIGTYRYVEFINTPYPILKENLTQFFLHNPFDDNAASFVCDNEVLNDVWELCKYSMKETSWCGIFVDGDRERKPYEADAYINQLGYYYVDTDFSISRYSHEYLMTHPTWPTEWPQHSIMMAWADYMFTGNTESLALNYNSLKDNNLPVSSGSARSLHRCPD